jgi:hypothetical protein
MGKKKVNPEGTGTSEGGTSSPKRFSTFMNPKMPGNKYAQRVGLLEKELKIKKDHAKVFWSENISAMLAIVGVILGVTEAELLRANEGNATAVMEAMKIAVSFTTVVLLFFVFRVHVAEHKLQQTVNVVPSAMPFVASAQFTSAVLESLVYVWHPMPFLGGKHRYEMSSGDIGEYTLDELLVCPMFLRLFACVPLLARTVGFASVKAKIAAKMNNIDINIGFTLKAILREVPIKAILSVTVALTVLLAYVLMLAERGLCDMDRESQRDYVHCPFSLYQNSVWNILIT